MKKDFLHRIISTLLALLIVLAQLTPIPVMAASVSDWGTLPENATILEDGSLEIEGITSIPYNKPLTGDYTISYKAKNLTTGIFDFAAIGLMCDLPYWDRGVTIRSTDLEVRIDDFSSTNYYIQEAVPTIKTDDFNEIVINVVSGKITVTVNGDVILTDYEPAVKAGNTFVIGSQSTGKVIFKDVKIETGGNTFEYFPTKEATDMFEYVPNVATQAEKDLAKAAYDGYLDDLSTFPFSVKIDSTNYHGFGSSFTIISRETVTEGPAKKTTIVFDRSDKLRFTLTTNFYEDYAAYDWTVWIENKGSANSPVISEFKAADMVFYGEDPYLRTNSSVNFYTPIEMAITGKKTFGIASGRSTEGAWPYYNLEFGEGGAFIALGWTGNWSTSFENLGNDELKFLAGQDSFKSYLKPGEKVRSPLISMLQFEGREVDRTQNLWRRFFIDCYSMKDENGELFKPMIAGSSIYWTNYLGATNEKDQLKYINTWINNGAKMDLWWLDAFWHTDFGNWIPDPNRFPTGLKAISDLAAANNIKTNLWFQPELTTYSKTETQKTGPGYSQIDPDWIIEGYAKSSDTYLLDFSNPDCVADQLQKIINTMEKGDISVYYEDFNYIVGMDWAAFNTANPTRTGMFENLYVQGHYSLWDSLKEHFPGLPIISCASGGTRNDLETMKRAIAGWRVDYYGACNVHAVEKQSATLALNSWLPYSGSCAVAMNHHPDKYSLRSTFTQSVICQFDVRENIDWNIVREFEDEWRRTVGEYSYDDYYPLTEYSLAENKWCAYEYFSDTKGSGYAMVFRRAECGPTQNIKFKGLRPDEQYQVWFEDAGKYGIYTGYDLMAKGIDVTLPAAETSDIIYISKVGNPVPDVALTANVTGAPADPLPPAEPITQLDEGKMKERPGLILDDLAKVGTNYKFSIRFNRSLRDTALATGEGYIEKNVQNDYLDLLYINGVKLRDILNDKPGSVTIDYDVKNNLLSVTVAENSSANINLTHINNVTLAGTLEDYEGVALGENIGLEWTPVEKSWAEGTAWLAPVSFVALNKNELLLAVGENEKLIPSLTLDSGVSWSSSDTSVASVDEDGTVTALKAGTATITVKTDAGDLTATCDVTVTEDVKVVNKANISGTLVGADGKPIANAEITLKDADGNAVATTKTDVNGKFTFADVEEGEYILYYNGVDSSIKIVIDGSTSDLNIYLQFKDGKLEEQQDSPDTNDGVVYIAAAMIIALATAVFAYRKRKMLVK